MHLQMFASHRINQLLFNMCGGTLQRVAKQIIQNMVFSLYPCFPPLKYRHMAGLMYAGKGVFFSVMCSESLSFRKIFNNKFSILLLDLVHCGLMYIFIWIISN